MSTTPVIERSAPTLKMMPGVHVSATILRRDPIEMIRVIRRASDLGAHLDATTWTTIREQAGTIAEVSRARLRDEWSEIMRSRDPAYALHLLRDAGLLEQSVPELMELTRMPDHGPWHPLSLWDHTMRVLSAVPPRLVVRWAALLHDIGKPRTRTHERSGRPRFFHHEEVGAAISREVLTDLQYSDTVVDAVGLLVETHMHIHAYEPMWTDAAVRRLVDRMGPCLDDAIALARADAAGHQMNPSGKSSSKFDDLEIRSERLDRQEEVGPVSPLNGHELMARFQLPPGPWIQWVKDALLREVQAGRLDPKDRETAWTIAGDILARREPC